MSGESLLNITRSAVFFGGHQTVASYIPFKEYLKEIRDGSSNYSLTTDGFTDWNANNPAYVFEVLENGTVYKYLYSRIPRLMDYSDGYSYADWLSYINSDKARFINYQGHGSRTNLMHMGYEQVKDMSNSIPFMTLTVSCSAGEFQDGQCIVKRMLAYDDTSGAVAAVAATDVLHYHGSTTNAWSHKFLRVFHDKLFDTPYHLWKPMGYYFQSSFNHTHIRNKADDSAEWANDFLAIDYFGDPALKLKIYQEQHDMEVYSIAIKKDGG